MSSFFSDTLSNPRFQFLATAVLSGATVASLILGYQALEREERLEELKSSIPQLGDGRHQTSKVILTSLPFVLYECGAMYFPG